MCADFLENNYDRVTGFSLFYYLIFNQRLAGAVTNVPLTVFRQVFTEYEKLLHSDNYVTKRQSLKVKSSPPLSDQKKINLT